MRSPFPGMDPYLEVRWSDVHLRLIGLTSAALQPLLPPGLRARAEERVLLEASEQDARVPTYRSDIAVVETRRPAEAGRVAEGPGTVEAVVIEMTAIPLTHRWVQIIDLASGNRVVTAIEVLSPGNKASGRLNTRYRRKLHDYARAEVNVVEIDLLRRSRARLEFDYDDLPPRRRAPYLASVRRAANCLRWEVYPLPLRDPLPAVPIPLRPDDRDVLLELQPLVDRAYADGGHDDIDYRAPPVPPLEGEDAAWADEMLRSAGRR